MANTLVRVRMLRHVAQFVQVVDLEMGETYELVPEKAAQFITNGMAEPESAIPLTPRLEAAALAAPRRRG
jgi:hypothetical protein